MKSSNDAFLNGLRNLLTSIITQSILF